jgi:hexosaminidase
VPPDQYRELKTIVVTPTGKRSQVTRTLMYNKTPSAAVDYQGTAKGMKYQLFTGEFTELSQLKDAVVIDTGTALSFNTSAFKKNMHGFGVIYTGFMRIDTDGNYGFSVASSGGSQLLIDDQLVVDNDGKHGIFDQGGAAPLLKGYHKVTIKYFEIADRGGLRVFMTIPDKPKGEISPDMMFN